MQHITRLFFGAAVLTLFGPTSPALASDKIYLGGDIITLVGDSPEYVEVIVVDDDKLALAGTTAHAMKQKADDATAVHRRVRTLLPGFIDDHGHADVAIAFQRYANLRTDDSTFSADYRCYR